MRRSLLPMILAVSLSALGSLAAPGATVAQTAQVFRVTGDAAPTTLAGAVGRALIDAGEQAGLEIVDGTDATLSDTTLLLGCSTVTPECMSELADVLGVDLLVYASVEPIGEGVEVRIHAFDGPRGAVAFSVRFEGTPASVPDRVRLDGSAFLRGHAVIHVDAWDEGARVEIAGRDVGPAPVTVRDLGPADYEVTVRDDGGREAVARLRCEVVGYCDLAVASPRGAGGLAPAWTVVGAGGAMLVASAGFGLLALRTRDDLRDEIYQREAHELREEGRRYARWTNVLLAAGALTATTGVVVLTRGRRADSAQVSVAPAPWGSGLMLRATW